MRSELEALEKHRGATGTQQVPAAVVTPLRYRAGMGYAKGNSLSTASLHRERSLCMRVPPQRIHHEVRLRNLWGGNRELSRTVERREPRSPRMAVISGMREVCSEGGRDAADTRRELRSGCMSLGSLTARWYLVGVQGSARRQWKRMKRPLTEAQFMSSARSLTARARADQLSGFEGGSCP